MSVPDPTAALVAYLRADTALYALVGARVYGAELPASEASHMPRAAVVVRDAGGMGARSEAPVWTPRVDVWCYGATPLEAKAVHLAVHAALRVLHRQVHAGALLHAASPGSGPHADRDPDTRWPLVWSSWTVIAGEEPA